MPGIADVAAEFEQFANMLKKERTKVVDRIAELSNGFEGWVKLEFFFWLVSKRKLAMSTPKTEKDIGLEYKLRLDGRRVDVSPRVKQCDLWVRDKSRNVFHYVELKAPFANGNKNKILTSAAYDLWCMSRIRKSYERAASGNAIVLGVGFTKTSWAEGLKVVEREGCILGDSELSGTGTLDSRGRVRYSVFTKRY